MGEPAIREVVEDLLLVRRDEGDVLGVGEERRVQRRGHHVLHLPDHRVQLQRSQARQMDGVRAVEGQSPHEAVVVVVVREGDEHLPLRDRVDDLDQVRAQGERVGYQVDPDQLLVRVDVQVERLALQGGRGARQHVHVLDVPPQHSGLRRRAGRDVVVPLQVVESPGRPGHADGVQDRAVGVLEGVVELVAVRSDQLSAADDDRVDGLRVRRERVQHDDVVDPVPRQLLTTGDPDRDVARVRAHRVVEQPYPYPAHQAPVLHSSSDWRPYQGRVCPLGLQNGP
jgi:hypothetical protein